MTKDGLDPRLKCGQQHVALKLDLSLSAAYEILHKGFTEIPVETLRIIVQGSKIYQNNNEPFKQNKECFMAGKYGVEESKDVLDFAIGVVAKEIVKEIKRDGFQVTDLGAFLKSPEFETKLAQALDGIQLVPSEMTEVDLFDGINLGRHAYGLIVDLMEEIKK